MTADKFHNLLGSLMSNRNFAEVTYSERTQELHYQIPVTGGQGDVIKRRGALLCSVDNTARCDLELDKQQEEKRERCQNRQL